MYMFSKEKYNLCLTRDQSMWKYWLLLFFLQAVVKLALALPIISSATSSSDLSPLPVLTPPANISECVKSNYCNNGTCVIIRDPSLRVSCTCDEPFVDSEAGLCTIKGKSRRTAFVIRCFPVFHLIIYIKFCSLLVGALGGDWFYLSHDDPAYVAIGTVCSQTFWQFKKI